MNMDEKLKIEQALVREYRKDNPRSRARSIIVHWHNTSCRKSMRCILCGESGPSWSALWPKTKQARKWENEHWEMEIEKHKETINENK